jgi:uncharacterized circularly permuted ATP-grasp superfamily protein
MSEGKLHVRTIAGLKRADVIWRRVDADWCDPLELNAASQLGVPGMLEAIRRGSVAVANMPGSGLVESRALLAFMPSLARRMLGEELKLPNIATWWCGQEKERENVLANFDDMTISGAFSDTVPGLSDRSSVLGADLDAAQRKALIAAMQERGMDFAGQEVVRLSTTPVWSEGKLTPRPFSLRVFAAATPDGWRVMPGGFCRVSGRHGDARAVTMGEGAQSTDVWVIGDKPVGGRSRRGQACARQGGVGSSLGMQMRRKTGQQHLALPELAAPVMQTRLAAQRPQGGGAQRVQLLLVAHQGLQAGCAGGGLRRISHG